MKLIDQYGNPLVAQKSLEGQYRDGPWFLPLTGGWLPQEVGVNWNWWQHGYDPVKGCGSSAMVEACVSAYSQTIAMCPGDHWLRNEKGGRDRVTTSALSRILKTPNFYQSASDFLLNLVRSLYSLGNGVALALRNDRLEVSELYLMNARTSSAFVAEDGGIFYELHGNPIIDRRFGKKIIVPQRDVLHVKLHTDENNPLLGLTPLGAAWLSLATGEAMARQQLTFYGNEARPSFILGTDLPITPAQAKDLREAWDLQSKGLGRGGTPMLGHGVKPFPLTLNAHDSQLAEIMKKTDQDIALAFRMPLQMLGIGGTPFASTEALMQFWLAGGLNFALNHIEVALDKFFKLKGQPDVYTEFNTDVLLRSALKDRVESYASGTRAGIFSPNEARAQFELPEVPHGDEPRMQQQDVPLSFGDELDPNSKPAPKPAAPAEDAPPSDKEIANDNERLRKSFRASRARSLAA